MRLQGRRVEARLPTMSCAACPRYPVLAEGDVAMTPPRMKQVELFVHPLDRDVAQLDEREAESLLRQCLTRLGQLGVRTSFAIYGKDHDE